MGLAGNLPDTIDIDAIPAFMRNVEHTGKLLLAQGQHEVDFPTEGGMNFHHTNLPLHENGMTITAFAGNEILYTKNYYSIGGGFIVDEEHFSKRMKMQFKSLIRLNMRQIYKSIVRKQVYPFLHW